MITLHPDVIAELVVLLKGAGIEGQFLSKLEEYLFNLKSYGNAAIGIKGAPMEHLAGESPLCLMRFPFASFALLEITVHSYGGTHFLAPPQCICCYLSFAILPQPVPAPYFSGVFSGKTRRMHIQCQKYLSGMAYSVFKELRKVLFSNPYTNMNLKDPWGIQFPKIF